jgi:hypothetical protein
VRRRKRKAKENGKAKPAGWVAGRVKRDRDKKAPRREPVNVLASPLRVHILSTIARRPLSPRTVAKECNLALARVSYHFRVLESSGCIELLRKVVRHGAEEPIYRATQMLGGTAWKQLPPSVRKGPAGSTLREFVNTACRALQAGTLGGREDSHFSLTSVVLDEQAWGEVGAMLESTRQRIEELESQSARRRTKSGEEGFIGTFALAGYEVPQTERRAV